MEPRRPLLPQRRNHPRLRSARHRVLSKQINTRRQARRRPFRTRRAGGWIKNAFGRRSVIIVVVASALAPPPDKLGGRGWGRVAVVKHGGGDAGSCCCCCSGGKQRRGGQGGVVRCLLLVVVLGMRRAGRRRGSAAAGGRTVLHLLLLPAWPGLQPAARSSCPGRLGQQQDEEEGCYRGCGGTHLRAAQCVCT